MRIRIGSLESKGGEYRLIFSRKSDDDRLFQRFTIRFFIFSFESWMNFEAIFTFHLEIILNYCYHALEGLGMPFSFIRMHHMAHALVK